MQLTNDADKLACSMYKSYLQKRHNGFTKLVARNFEINEIQSYSVCSKWCLDDIKTIVSELKNADFGDMYYSGSFLANESFIIYMENRFINGLKEVTDFITKFIP